MSNDEIPTGGEAEEASPDLGVADEAAEQAPAEVEPEPEYEYLEVGDEDRAKYVRAKIDGEEASVPFEELVNSYSRESVSTKRFQEAAALRQEAEQAMRLQQALQVNPGLTVQYLAQQAGVPVEQYLNMSPQQRQDATDDMAVEPTFEDPLERKLHEQQQQLEAMQNTMAQRAQDEQLMSAVGQLKATYQIDDSQAREVVYQASQLGVGIEALPMVYQSMAYQASQQATAQHSAEQEAEAQRRRQAAANASAVSGSSVPSAASASTEVASGNYSDIRAATAAALDELGIS